MKINRTRPVLAFLLVAVACGIVIAQGLRASALTVVVSGRPPAAFAAGSIPGALFGPVFSLRLERGPVTRPVLTDRSEQSGTVTAVSRSGSSASGDKPARAVTAVIVASAPVATAATVAVVPAAASPAPSPAPAAVQAKATKPAKQHSRAKAASPVSATTVSAGHVSAGHGKAKAAAKAGDQAGAKSSEHGAQAQPQDHGRGHDKHQR